MKIFLLPGVLSILIMTATTASALAPSSTNSTGSLINSPDIMASSSPSAMLISVGPDWMQKLPRVKDTISREVAEFLKSNYARGNRKDAWVEVLEARGTRLYMRAKVRHHHAWKRPWGGFTTMYDVTNTIETTFDPLNQNQTLDGSRMCFDLAPQIGGGKVCASVRDVVRIIVAGL